MIKKILAAVAIVVASFLTYVYFKPSHYTFTREITINAPATTVFPFINESKKLDAWMPWKEMDPNMQSTTSGPDGGVGATSSWTSEGKMGTGSAVITESVPDQSVTTKLEYVKPYVMHQVAQMKLKENGNTTTLIWTVDGENNFVGRIFCTLMNGEKMVGGMFEKGLATLKDQIEKSKP